MGLAFFGPEIAPHDPNATNLADEMRLPDSNHWFGTDENGRDILSRIAVGCRISLGIGLAVISLCLLMGVGLGLLAGFSGGRADRIFGIVADVFQAFPGILLAIFLAAFLPPSILNIILLLSFVGWVSYARVTRAQVLSLKEKEYIEAARALGVGPVRIGIFHLLPNLAGPLIVQAAFGMAGVILTESTLSFLGLGIPIQYPSWGRMLDSGASLLLVAPHLSLIPGLAILISVLTFNLLGDRLKERFS